MNPSAKALQQTANILFNRPIARDTFRLRIAAPAIARSILPGQFVMVRAAGRYDPLLARPLALYDVADDGQSLDVVYLVMGNGTRCLSRLADGAEVDLWGPLGNVFPELSAEAAQHLVIVAGGIGQTPFVALLAELVGQRRYGGRTPPHRPNRITFQWGLRGKDWLAELEDFERTGVTIELASNDGSVGHHGLVTDLTAATFESPTPPTALFACGPEPMLAAVAKLAQHHQVPCWVSLETKMACGYGVCFSCVSPVLEDQHENGWDYRRVCLDGPVFDGHQLAWQQF